MPTVKWSVQKKYSRKMRELLDMLNDNNVRKNVNTIIADEIQPYVPMKSGRLRRSRIVGAKTISWGRGLEYAHYQHEGVVYAPNYPIIKNGSVVGWYSPRGKGTKHPTDRELGGRGLGGIGVKSSRDKAVWMNWNFGYTTPGTMHHWERMYEWELKRETNIKITRMLKMLCKQRGLSV